ncbi:hypothetical protein V6R86_13110 [Sphingomonas kaistensis]|uniref:Uncharacterized protein n=1 Tax=Sphingomonas kaistensis TaxID=298708 RepID=A0ABZ2G563_9SPHN
MRYKDLFDAKAWRKYAGRDRLCRLVPLTSDQSVPTDIIEVPVQSGTVSTGRARVFAGWFCSVGLPTGEMVLAEDPHNLGQALRNLEERLNATGWSLDAIGLDERWEETGLSSNTGWGYHPQVHGAAHMLDPKL